MSFPVPAPEGARVGVAARRNDPDHVADALGRRDDAFDFPVYVDFGHVAAHFFCISLGGLRERSKGKWRGGDPEGELGRRQGRGEGGGLTC